MERLHSKSSQRFQTLFATQCLSHSYLSKEFLDVFADQVPGRKSTRSNNDADGVRSTGAR